MYKRNTRRDLISVSTVVLIITGFTSITQATQITEEEIPETDVGVATEEPAEVFPAIEELDEWFLEGRHNTYESLKMLDLCLKAVFSNLGRNDVAASEYLDKCISLSETLAGTEDPIFAEIEYSTVGDLTQEEIVNFFSRWAHYFAEVKVWLDGRISSGEEIDVYDIYQVDALTARCGIRNMSAGLYDFTVMYELNYMGSKFGRLEMAISKIPNENDETTSGYLGECISIGEELAHDELLNEEDWGGPINKLIDEWLPGLNQFKVWLDGEISKGERVDYYSSEGKQYLYLTRDIFITIQSFLVGASGAPDLPLPPPSY